MNLPQCPHLPKVPVTVNEPSRRASLLLAVGSIDDYGRSNLPRYSCTAEDADGQIVSGNPKKDLKTCLLCVHWNDWKMTR